MSSANKLIGIVTARGNSKTIPHKNLYPVAGAPLTYYCIENARRSGIFDRIIISTDDQRIADVAKSYGVDVPFIRPQELAQDDTPHFEVIKHALDWMCKEEVETYGYAAIIHPTAPTIQGFHWEEAWELLLEKKGDSVISVMEMPAKYHPSKAMLEDKQGTLIVPAARREGLPRQNLFKAWYATAGIYIFKTANLSGGDFYGEKVVPYEIDDEQYAIDVNDLDDIDRARSAILFYETPADRMRDAELYEELKKGTWPLPGEKNA